MRVVHGDSAFGPASGLRIGGIVPALVLVLVVLTSCSSSAVDDIGGAPGSAPGAGFTVAVDDGDGSSGSPPGAGATVPVDDTGVRPAVSPSPDSWAVARVVDGDTLVVDGPGGEVTVRIIGINTPERGECLADDATEALEALVAGEELRLVADVSDVDQYGRVLRYVETAGGVDVGAELVARGLAIARRYEPDVARSDRYSSLQERARDDELGLWARDACGGNSVDADAFVIEVHADAPGDDNLNLNGEWVRFTNTSEAWVDLGGWQVADESATHRYVFDERRLAPGGAVVLFTGCGVDAAAEVYWCKEDSAVWNNSGDTVFLRDADGNPVAILGYGGSASP